MKRENLITKAKKTKGIELPRPAHMCSNEQLQNAIEKAVGVKTEVKKEQEKTLKDRIIELGGEGTHSKKEIQKILENEGWGEKVKGGKVRYAYVFVVLKNNNISVPKATRKKKEPAKAEVENTEDGTSGNAAQS